ncbi:hypothetical protein VTL71DRAFT_16109 [Oculimacula yallundae]|uniref:Uncharacterized protein n=1 Tax=Oculimacula yallundae TaxID=86028 RepID=A0ABR4CFL3_9HELO
MRWLAGYEHKPAIHLSACLSTESWNPGSTSFQPSLLSTKLPGTRTGLSAFNSLRLAPQLCLLFALWFSPAVHTIQYYSTLRPSFAVHPIRSELYFSIFPLVPHRLSHHHTTRPPPSAHLALSTTSHSRFPLGNINHIVLSPYRLALPLQPIQYSASLRQIILYQFDLFLTTSSPLACSTLHHRTHLSTLFTTSITTNISHIYACIR